MGESLVGAWLILSTGLSITSHLFLELGLDAVGKSSSHTYGLIIVSIATDLIYGQISKLLVVFCCPCVSKEMLSVACITAKTSHTLCDHSKVLMQRQKNHIQRIDLE